MSLWFPSTKATLNTRTQPHPITPNAPHALVIGSGFGGLAAAVRLLVRGYRVTVLERLEQLGGRARVHREQGFTFDAGPTVITAPFLFEELWSLCGQNMADHVDLREVTPFYRIRFDDGDVFNYTGSAAEMRKEVARISPQDVAGYEAFIRQSETIFQVGFESLAHTPFDHPWDMARIVPAMMRLASYRTVYGLVSQYIKHPKLRQVLSFHPLLVGGNPYSTTSIYTLIAFLERKWGVHFPMGGTGALVQGLADLIRSQGGQLRCNAEVSEITVNNRRTTGVRLSNGEHIPADIVISNADSMWTYKHLIAKEHRPHWSDRRIEGVRSSMSLFVWYFGTDRKYPDVPHHSILLGPRYKGLLKDIFDRKVLANDFSLYLHRPTHTDPSLAPEGCDAFYVLSPVPHLQSDTDWATQTEPYRQAIERYLSGTVLPGLESHIVASRTLTPQGFLDDYLSFRGSAFGVEPILTQSAYMRPHNQSEDVQGLYFVGAGTHPGAGLPGVLSSARILDTVVPDADHLRAQRFDYAPYKREVMDAIKEGSKTFYLASQLLPKRVRVPAAVLYQFFRDADDAIDTATHPSGAITTLRQRVDALYSASPNAADEAMHALVQHYDIPQALFDAMLEGFAWDCELRRYATLDDLLAYCVRVASTVGAAMTLLMGHRERATLARACDLGVAMQLTNIARDIGEDARQGRLYMPIQWLEEARINPDAWLDNPHWDIRWQELIKRLLDAAQHFYTKAQPGIRDLHQDCQAAIYTASQSYADIGEVIRKQGYNSIDTRAYTSRARKLWRLTQAATKRRRSNSQRNHSIQTGPALPQAEFLIDAIMQPATFATKAAQQAQHRPQTQSAARPA